MEPFGRRLRRLREKKQITVEEMAREIGVPKTTYREWEYGRAIKGEPYAKIARALDVTLAELLTGKRPSKAKALDQIELILETALELKSELLSFL